MGRGAPDRERDEADAGFLGKDFVAFSLQETETMVG